MDISVISVPLYMILPDVGLIIPTISLASVDLPLPLGPVMATNLLSSILRLIPLIISFCFPSSSLTLNLISLSSSIL